MTETMTNSRDVAWLRKQAGRAREMAGSSHAFRFSHLANATRYDRIADALEGAENAGVGVSIPELLAADVLDEIEAGIAAGKAMGHGAWAILNRVWRLLQPTLRADAERFSPGIGQ